MKNNPALLGFFLLLLSSVCLQAQSNIQQSLSVNSSGAAADASAQLDVSATDKGMLVPRMTSAQRTAIASPATGLLVFDTDSNGFWFYNGVGWASISASRQLIDTDNDTKIQVEETADEDIIRFDLAGTENMVLRKNAGGSPRLELHNLLSNTFVGMNAGNATSTGIANTAMGTDALAVNSTGESNTAVGRSSLLANTTGSNNVAIGDRTLFANSTGTTNVAMGATTMLANTTGSHNTAIGTGALPKNTTGYSNTAIGRRALFNSVFSSNLVAVGDSALFSSVSGAENVALGSKALFANTSGSNNTATGYQALFANTTGSNNTALGNKADVLSGTLTNATAIGYNAKVGASNSLVLGGTGADAVNVGIGVTNPAATLHVNGSIIAKGITDADNDTKVQVEESPDEDIIRFDLAGTEHMVLRKNAGGHARLELLDAIENTFIGQGAGASTTTGDANTAIGKNALSSNTEGFRNLAIGPDALLSNTNGNLNLAIGSFALKNNSIGVENTALGSASLFSNTTGSNNTAVGQQTMNSNTIGNSNTATGDGAMYNTTTGSNNTSNGRDALLMNTTGGNNTALGYQSLFTNTTGSNNTAVGTFADVTSGTLTNATAIGYNASVNASNKVRIGNASVTVIEGQVDWTFPSDARFKFNIHDDAVPGLAFIEKLRPVTYQFDTRKFDEHLMQNMPDSVQQRRMAGQDYSKSSAIMQTGFLAQEVEQACKDLNFDFSGLHVPESEVDNYGLAYGSFVPLLVKSIQEQQAIIQKLEAENASLKARDKQQAAQLDKITAALAGAGIAVEK